MKIIPSTVGLLLAGSIVTGAEAEPSKNEIFTSCKALISESFEAAKNINLKRFRDKSSGTYLTFTVFREGAEATRVTCIFRDGAVSLTDADGDMISKSADASLQ